MQRQLGRHVDDEVALAALGDVVDDFLGAVDQRLLHFLDALWGEPAVDDPAQLGVVRRIDFEAMTCISSL